MTTIVSSKIGMSVCLALSIAGLAANIQNSYAGQTTPENLKSMKRWTGTWDCNLDGRLAEMKLRLSGSRTSCDTNSNVCKIVHGDFHLYGWIRDISRSGNWVKLTDRKRGRSDPPTRRSEHVLYLKYPGKTRMTLLMHTWDNNYMSGYTLHRGTPYGIQCSHRY